MNRISNNVKKLFAAAVVLCCCAVAVFADNPVKGKTYVADMMGIEFMTLEFSGDSTCVMTAMTDMNSSESMTGTYTFNSNSTVSITMQGDTLDFPYDKASDALILDMDGLKIELKVKKAAYINPDAKAPSSLTGRTYAGNLMGIEFMIISFNSDSSCTVKVADDVDYYGSVKYETAVASYSYDKDSLSVKLTYDGEDMDFKYNPSRNTLEITEPSSGLTIQLEQK